jgi:hypothetical protein
VEDANRNVFPPGRATAAKHETRRGEDGLRHRVSNLGQQHEAEEQALVRRSHRSQDDTTDSSGTTSVPLITALSLISKSSLVQQI